MPALYALAVRRLLPRRFAIVGVARTDGDDDAFRQDMQDAVKQHARDPFRQDVWDELAAQLHWVTTDFADAGGEDKLHDLVDEARRGAAARRQPRLLPRRPAAGVPHASSTRSASGAANARLDAARRREAVRPRPRLGAAS